MNVIVTGGNGFLGSGIVEKLILENHNVLVVSKNTNNIIHMRGRYKFISSYMDEFDFHIKEIENFSPDVILFLGWDGANTHKDINRLDQYHRNVPYHIKTLELINKFNYKPKIIGVGSFAEYGDYPIPITEEFCEKPTSLYGISKFTVKQYSQLYCKLNDIDWGWIRPCFIYGNGDVSTRLIPTLIHKFINNKPVSLDGCGTIIDYLHIDDFVSFAYGLITSDCGGVYNICSGNQYILKNIVTDIHRLTNSKSDIIFDEKLDRNMPRFICGNNEKIKKSLGLTNQIDIERGLVNTISHNEK